MIVTKLIGGLGNQMFQYAAGIALAKKLNCSVKADINGFKSYKLHTGYQFNTIFKNTPLTANYFDTVSLLGMKGFKSRKVSCEIAPEYAYSAKDKLVRQNTHNYAPYFDEIDHSCYLSGYWQSEKYFLEAKSEIAQAFTFSPFKDDENLRFQENILNQPSASIHIRRGDYVTNASANKFHGLCSDAYYQDAIAKLKAHKENINFFVFSDDPAEAEKVLGSGSEFTYVSHNTGQSSHNDMHLMSLCKNHIIANSTFSWWGAWLSDTQNEMIIAPKIWFADMKEPIVDIYCPKWQLI